MGAGCLRLDHLDAAPGWRGHVSQAVPGRKDISDEPKPMTQFAVFQATTHSPITSLIDRIVAIDSAFGKIGRAVYEQYK